MTKYVNNGGPHELACGKVVANGETFECDSDLQALFPNKFEVVGDIPKVVPGPPTASNRFASFEEVPTTSPPETPTAPKKGPTPEAKDVSGGFASAKDYDVQVLRDKRGWWVVDGDEVLNSSGPLKKGGVNTFIERTFEE